MSDSKTPFLPTTLHQSAAYLKAAIQDSMEKQRMPDTIMLHSSPGVGKSSIVAQLTDWAQELFEQKWAPGKKFRFIDVRVAAMDPADVQGVPFVPQTIGTIDVDDPANTNLVYSTPEWFPKEDECGILFLDELANASIPCQQACYRIVLDRSIHNGKKMPREFIIIAAGNRKGDKTGAKGLIPALASRFTTHLYINADVNEFVAHGLANDFNEYVMGFLNFEPQHLIGEQNASEMGYPNPRNWESVSKILSNPYMDQQQKRVGVYGAVGMTAGQELYGYIAYYKILPDFEKIEQGEEAVVSKEVTSERGAQFALMMATTHRLMQALRKKDYVVGERLVALYDFLDPGTAGIAIRVIKKADEKLMIGVMRDGRVNSPKLFKLVDDTIKKARAL